MIKFEINSLPPSENHAMLQRGFRRFPSKELVAFRKIIDSTLPPFVLPFDKSDKIFLDFTIWFYCPLYNKGNGEIRRFDVHNYDKHLIDYVCTRLRYQNGEEVDDRVVKSVILEKFDSPTLKTVVQISTT